MKLSKKLKRKLKKRLLMSMSSITIVLMLLAGSKLGGFSASFEHLTNSEDYTTIVGTDSLFETSNDSSANPDAELQIATLSETATV